MGSPARRPAGDAVPGRRTGPSQTTRIRTQAPRLAAGDRRRPRRRAGRQGGRENSRCARFASEKTGSGVGARTGEQERPPHSVPDDAEGALCGGTRLPQGTNSGRADRDRRSLKKRERRAPRTHWWRAAPPSDEEERSDAMVPRYRNASKRPRHAAIRATPVAWRLLRKGPGAFPRERLALGCRGCCERRRGGRGRARAVGVCGGGQAPAGGRSPACRCLPPASTRCGSRSKDANGVVASSDDGAWLRFEGTLARLRAALQRLAERQGDPAGDDQPHSPADLPSGVAGYSYTTDGSNSDASVELGGDTTALQLAHSGRGRHDGEGPRDLRIGRRVGRDRHRDRSGRRHRPDGDRRPRAGGGLGSGALSFDVVGSDPGSLSGMAARRSTPVTEAMVEYRVDDGGWQPSRGARHTVTIDPAVVGDGARTPGTSRIDEATRTVRVDVTDPPATDSCAPSMSTCSSTATASSSTPTEAESRTFASRPRGRRCEFSTMLGARAKAGERGPQGGRRASCTGSRKGPISGRGRQRRGAGARRMLAATTPHPPA
jgi:hypothetical protein